MPYGENIYIKNIVTGSNLIESGDSVSISFYAKKYGTGTIDRYFTFHVQYENLFDGNVVTGSLYGINIGAGWNKYGWMEVAPTGSQYWPTSSLIISSSGFNPPSPPLFDVTIPQYRFDDFKIEVSRPYLDISQEGMIFYAGEDTQIQMNKSGILIKGGSGSMSKLEVGDLTSYGLIRSRGDMQIEGNIVITGSAFSEASPDEYYTPFELRAESGEVGRTFNIRSGEGTAGSGGDINLIVGSGSDNYHGNFVVYHAPGTKKMWLSGSNGDLYLSGSLHIGNLELSDIGGHIGISSSILDGNIIPGYWKYGYSGSQLTSSTLWANSSMAKKIIDNEYELSSSILTSTTKSFYNSSGVLSKTAFYEYSYIANELDSIIVTIV